MRPSVWEETVILLMLGNGYARERVELHVGAEHVSRSCRNISVLMIVGDDGLRTALAAILREDGHAVHDFTPEHPLPQHVLQQIAVAVVTHDPSAGDGFVFADTLHAQRPDVPVVLLTPIYNESVWAGGVMRDFVHVSLPPVDYESFHTWLHHLSAAAPL